MRTTIPKRIIQTGKRPPEAVRGRAIASSLRMLNPDFEFLFFDDRKVDAFIRDEFPQYKTVFDSFRFPIQRYDFFRYLAVYRYGGFYFDLDVLLASSLSPLLEYSCVFPFEGITFSKFLREQRDMDWEIGNYAFGAAAGHTFLEAVIENCVRAQKEPGWLQPMLQGLPLLSKAEFYVLYSTGPGLISRTLAESPELARTVKVLFPDDVCDLKNWNHFGDFGVHLMDASWRTKRSWLGRRLALYLEGMQLGSLVKQSARKGKSRQNNGAGERSEVLAGSHK